MVQVTKYFLGIDTSAYTTSIGVVDEFGHIVSNQKKILKVKNGQRGLRQQEAIFQHMMNFPELLDTVAQEVDLDRVSSIAVSTRPRNMDGSYMPVFKYGESQAQIMSRLLGVSLQKYSHQEGHIGSALLEEERKNFISIHISGGTTEVLSVSVRESEIAIDIIGETKDISLGQLIDRIGVKMGFEFPAGKSMENSAKSGHPIDLRLSKSITGLDVNLSGLESQMYRAIDSNEYSTSCLCKALFEHVSDIISEIVVRAVGPRGEKNVYLVGGVSSNAIIRNRLSKISGIELILPRADLSTDNGVGLAYLARRREG